MIFVFHNRAALAAYAVGTTCRSGFLGAAVLVTFLGTLLGTFLGMGCHPSDPSPNRALPSLAPEAGGQPPNIVLVVLDTAARDRMSLYGYGRETTPEILKLASEARLFSRAYSTSSWTAPAHASMFTGLFPVAHGVTQEDWTFSDGHEALAEILAARGYATRAVVGNPMLSIERGFSQGFEDYRQTWRRGERRKTAKGFASVDESTVLEVEDLLKQHDDARPLFLFVNLIGVHAPYDSCGSFCDRFVTDPSIENVGAALYRHYLVEPFAPEVLRHLGERYDAEILEVDRLVGRLVSLLRERGIWDETLFVLTSDHGENLGHERNGSSEGDEGYEGREGGQGGQRGQRHADQEGGHLGHVFTLSEATTRVPLLLRSPTLRGKREVSQEPVQLVDLFPSILRAAGVDPDPYGASGLDLLDPALAGPAGAEARPLLLEYYLPKQALGVFLARANSQQKSRLARFDRHLRAVIDGRWKLVDASDGSFRLYDLQNDPDERTDLARDASRTAVVKRLRERMTVLLEDYAVEGNRAVARNRAVEGKGRGAGGSGTAPPLREETRRALEAIGYLE